MYVYIHLMRRADSFEKTLILGKIEGRRRRGWQRIRWLDAITDSMDMSLSKLWESWCWTGRPGVLQTMGSQRIRHDWATELNCTLSKHIRNCFSLSLPHQPGNVYWTLLLTDYITKLSFYENKNLLLFLKVLFSNHTHVPSERC